MSTRQLRVVPGYDCKNVPCQHTPKGEHGIHCDEWIYTVSTPDRVFVAELVVYTKLYPATDANRRLPPEGVRGTFFRIHVGAPALHDAELRLPQHSCTYTAAGKCWDIEYGATWPEARFKEFGDPNQPEQPERFWAWMETQLEENAAKLRGALVDPVDDRVRLETWLREIGTDSDTLTTVVRGDITLGDLRRWLTDRIEQVTHYQTISTVIWEGPTEPEVEGEPVDFVVLELPATHPGQCMKCDTVTRHLFAVYDVRDVTGWSFRCYVCTERRDDAR